VVGEEVGVVVVVGEVVCCIHQDKRDKMVQREHKYTRRQTDCTVALEEKKYTMDTSIHESITNMHTHHMIYIYHAMHHIQMYTRECMQSYVPGWTFETWLVLR
jgi:hypothetical protein